MEDKKLLANDFPIVIGEKASLSLSVFKHGLTLSTFHKDAEPEYQSDRVGIARENLDFTILALLAARKCIELGIDCRGLFVLEDTIVTENRFGEYVYLMPFAMPYAMQPPAATRSSVLPAVELHNASKEDLSKNTSEMISLPFKSLISPDL